MTTVMIPDRNALQKNAQRFLAAGRIPQAVEELLKILRDYPNDFNLMMQIGELYLQTGQSARAIPLFQRVAEHHCAEGFLLKAIAIYKRIHRLNPGLVETRIQLADLYSRQGLITEARFELLAAVDYYERRRQSREAIRLYHKLIDLTPTDLEARSELARIYEREGMVSEAVGQYLELSTRSIQQEHIADGLAALEKARRLNPSNAAVLWKMLWIYLEQDEFEKAGRLLEEFIAINPSDPEMLGLIIKTFSQPSQLERMLDLVNRAMAATPGRESLLVLKGELFLRLGNIEAAYVEFVSAMEGMLSRGEPNRAIALARRMARYDSSFHPAWELLVDLYIQQGL
ncbi:MAG TPA: tetratricopeptide repeat protein, partial [Acidobacteriota bacterium]|nr:tetratricopeptide repeat protein [Acidobacteriota bacterium]